jgi:hypothetical protein
MHVRVFFYRSFGILALLAAAFAAISSRGPWLDEFPRWVVAVPLGLAVVLVCLGLYLMRVRLQRTEHLSNSTYATIKVIIGLVALSGIVLTSYYHGDSAADRSGTHLLVHVVTDFLIITPIIAAISSLIFWTRGRRPTAPARHKLPVKKI